MGRRRDRLDRRREKQKKTRNANAPRKKKERARKAAQAAGGTDQSLPDVGLPLGVVLLHSPLTIPSLHFKLKTIDIRPVGWVGVVPCPFGKGA